MSSACKLNTFVRDCEAEQLRFVLDIHVKFLLIVPFSQDLCFDSLRGGKRVTRPNRIAFVLQD